MKLEQGHTAHLLHPMQQSVLSAALAIVPSYAVSQVAAKREGLINKCFSHMLSNKIRAFAQYLQWVLRFSSNCTHLPCEIDNALINRFYLDVCLC